jgi:KDO2-lipid IV(A) lauroyltransferase
MSAILELPAWRRLAGRAALLAAALLRRLPERAAYGLADCATPAVAAFALLHERRAAREGRGAVRNLRIVYRERLTRAGALRLLLAWARHLSTLAVDFARMPRIDARTLREHVDTKALEPLLPLAEAGAGLICVSAHAGFWELCGHAATLWGMPVTIVARPLAWRELDAAAQAIRCSGGQRVLAKWNALWPLKKALDRGEVIGLLADEDERRRPVFAPFLGTLAASTPVPAFLQQHSGAPIAVVSCHRVGRARFRFDVWRVIRAEETAGASREKAIRATTEAINEALSRAILAHPEQWLWGSRRFATRPPGERPGPDGLPPRAALG